MIETTVSSSRSAKAWRKDARAPSVARPRPHAGRANRQPTSTAGRTDGRNDGTARPTKPRHSSGSSRAAAHHRPNPRCSQCSWMASNSSSLWARVNGTPSLRNSTTSGSALSRAKGARSDGRQERSARRSVVGIGAEGWRTPPVHGFGERSRRDFHGECGFAVPGLLTAVGRHPKFPLDAEPSRRERGPGVARPAALTPWRLLTETKWRRAPQVARNRVAFVKALTRRHGSQHL